MFINSEKEENKSNLVKIFNKLIIKPKYTFLFFKDEIVLLTFNNLNEKLSKKSFKRFSKDNIYNLKKLQMIFLKKTIDFPILMLSSISDYFACKDFSFKCSYIIFIWRRADYISFLSGKFKTKIQPFHMYIYTQKRKK